MLSSFKLILTNGTKGIIPNLTVIETLHGQETIVCNPLEKELEYRDCFHSLNKFPEGKIHTQGLTSIIGR